MDHPLIDTPFYPPPHKLILSHDAPHRQSGNVVTDLPFRHRVGHKPSQKMDSPPSRHFKSVDSKMPLSIILSSDMREGGTRPDDLAVAIRAEGVRDAMMVVG